MSIETASPATTTPQPTLYRYEVTAVSGAIAQDIKPGDVMQDTYHGEEYTWTIANLQTGKTVSTITGRCLGPVS